MKKIVCLLLTLVCAFAFFACGEGEATGEVAIINIANSAEATKITTIASYVLEDEVYNGEYVMLVNGNDSIFEFKYDRRASVAEMADSYKVKEEGVVYYKNGLYSYDGAEWNSEAASAIKIDFNLDLALFDSYELAGNTLNAVVSGENVAKVLGSDVAADGAVELSIITNGTYLSRIEVSYKTANGAAVAVDTSYTYDVQELVFPE
ncbi:MAG: hypothetical protein IJX97_04080 [Clostridia bacterium]|nr:hypothetical protein [Clostridia bacterium]MBQ8720080.1 hypothetical protein [Clostridia bacterium]